MKINKNNELKGVLTFEHPTVFPSHWSNPDWLWLIDDDVNDDEDFIYNIIKL